MAPEADAERGHAEQRREHGEGLVQVDEAEAREPERGQ